MFSKAKDKKQAADKKTKNTAQTEAAVPGASTPTASHAAKRQNTLKPAGVPSIISSDVILSGNINATGEVQFDGILEGDVKAAMLIVGEKAEVKGEIRCEKVIIRGRVEGGIRAKEVTLAASSHIEGDIVHSSLSVENGAHFEGACRHSDDPLADADASDLRKKRPAPPPVSTPVRSDASEEATPETSQEEPKSEQTPLKTSRNGTPSFLSTARSPLR